MHQCSLFVKKKKQSTKVRWSWGCFGHLNQWIYYFLLIYFNNKNCTMCTFSKKKLSWKKNLSRWPQGCCFGSLNQWIHYLLFNNKNCTMCTFFIKKMHFLLEKKIILGEKMYQGDHERDCCFGHLNTSKYTNDLNQYWLLDLPKVIITQVILTF